VLCEKWQSRRARTAVKNVDMEKENTFKKLSKMFFCMLSISAFTFGGGFVIASFMKKKFVEELHWIEEDEMLDIIALAQSSPGAIAVNVAILTGLRLGGFLGMVMAVIATIIPPVAIISVISLFYNAFSGNLYVALLLKGMQAGVAALLLDVVLGLFEKVIKLKSALHIAIMAVAFLLVWFFKINVIYIVAGTLALGVIWAFIMGKRGNENELP